MFQISLNRHKNFFPISKYKLRGWWWRVGKKTTSLYSWNESTRGSRGRLGFYVWAADENIDDRPEYEGGIKKHQRADI